MAEAADEAVLAALQVGDRRAATEAIEAYHKAAPKGADSALREAAMLVAAGEAPQAVWLLDETLTRRPERYDVAVSLAHAALIVGDATLARRAADSVPAGSKEELGALLVLARAELELGDLEAALQTLKTATARHPDRPEAKLARITMLLEEGQLEDAEQVAEDARRALIEAGNLESITTLDLLLAQIAGRADQPERAAQRLVVMASAEDADPRVWSPLLASLQGLDRSDEALELIEAAHARDPDDIALLTVVARARATNGDFEGAEEALRQAVRESDRPGSWNVLASFLSAAGKDEGAAIALRQAVERHPGDVTLRARLADRELAGGDVAAAREHLTALTATHRGNAWARYVRARIELSEDRAANAAHQLTALAPDLDLPAVHYWLGRALEDTGDREGALRRYLRASDLDRYWSPPLEAALRLSIDRRSWADVQRLAAALMRSDPDRLDAFLAAATAMTEGGQRAEAIDLLDATAKRFPNRQEPRLAAALAEASTHNEDALVRIAAIRTEFGESPELAVTEARVLALSGRVEDGLNGLEAALANDPERAGLHALRAELLFALGRGDEGGKATERALALAPEDLEPLRQRCRYHAASGLWTKALADCRRWSVAYPDDPEILAILGLALQESGRREEAIGVYRTVASLDRRSVLAHNNLAELLSESGDTLGALDAAQRAYALAPEHPAVLDTLASLYLEQGLAARALALLEKARRLAPDDPEIGEHLRDARRRVAEPTT